MPKIEIVSLRLNLDKDEDRRLWESLQSKSEPGKRNEFLKQSLLRCLSEGKAGVEPPERPERPSRKRVKEPEATAGRVEERLDSADPPDGDAGVDVRLATVPVVCEQETGADNFAAAAGFVSRFVQ